MPEVSPPPPWPCSGESSRPVSLQPSECVHTGDSCERGTLCSRCSTVAPRRSAAASAPLQAPPSLLGVEAAVLTEAGDLQRQVPPLSQSHDPAAAVPARQALRSAVHLRRWLHTEWSRCARRSGGQPMAGRPARRGGEQGLPGQDRSSGFAPKSLLEQREMCFCACNSTTNTEVMVL